MDWTTASCSVPPSGKGSSRVLCDVRRVVFPRWSCAIPGSALAFEAVSCPSPGGPPGKAADPAVSMTCPLLACGGPGLLPYLGARQSCRCPGSQPPFCILGVLWISITTQPLPRDHSRPHAPPGRSMVFPLSSSCTSPLLGLMREGGPLRAGEWAPV